MTCRHEDERRPCGYCWQPDEEREPGDYMIRPELYDPPCGYDPIHPECQRMVDDYMEELARDRRAWGGVL
jgi:hypothetical protein